MGQLECGQCGYLCQTYAEAIAAARRKSFGRCVPGGKETARMLKELMASRPPRSRPRPRRRKSTRRPRRSRPDPPCRRVSRARCVSIATAPRRIRAHIVFRHNGLPLAYKVGDALGVHVANDPEVVAIILERLGAVPSREVDCPDGSSDP